jgi:hypothetical protein
MGKSDDEANLMTQTFKFSNAFIISPLSLLILMIAQSIQRRYTGSMTVVRFPAWATDYSLFHIVRSRVHLVSYPVGTGGSFPGGKATGA